MERKSEMLKQTRRFLGGIACLVAVGWTVSGSAASASAKTDYEVAPVENPGSMAGRVTLEGEVPEPRSLPINTDVEACGEGERIVDVVDVSEDGGLGSAVVEIMGIAAGKEWDPAALDPVLDQVSCVFKVSNLVVAKGQTLKVVNSDPIFHNVHTYEVLSPEKRRTMFNIGQPNQGQVTPQRIRLRRSNVMKIECDAHSFMHAHMYFASSPYYAETGIDGSFEIDGIPAGAYTVTVWHAVLGRQEAEIEITAGEVTAADFVFTHE